jgi:predicted esterase
MLNTQPQLANATATHAHGRLLARPSAKPESGSLAGRRRLNIADPRDGLIFVPATYRPEQPLPLLLALHGASGSAEQGAAILSLLANTLGVIILAPDSRQATWDAIRGGYGSDVAFIDAALEQTFSRYAVDPRRVGVSGFSDGASYALSLGLNNGDLFTHIIGLSPGFIPPGQPVGRPGIFIAHGTLDRVLPIERCSRRIVPQLQRQGYDVRYREFDGPHILPPRIAFAALRWFTSREPIT